MANHREFAESALICYDHGKSAMIPYLNTYLSLRLQLSSTRAELQNERVQVHLLDMRLHLNSTLIDFNRNSTRLELNCK